MNHVPTPKIFGKFPMFTEKKPLLRLHNAEMSFNDINMISSILLYNAISNTSI